MKKVFVLTLLLASVQSFAAVHAVSRTVKESVKVAKYPTHFVVKGAKVLARGAYAVGKVVI